MFGFRLSWIAAALAVLLLTPALAWSQAAGAPPLDATAKREVVAQIAQNLKDKYIFPDRGVAAGEKVKAELAAGHYDAIADPTVFAGLLTSDLRSVTHDLHMRVNFEGVQIARRPPPTHPEPSSEGGVVQVDRLRGNIGYIEVMGFLPPELAEPAMAKAMGLVGDTRALIFDLRGNGGGDPAAVEYLCSFLFDPGHPVHLNDLIWRKEGTDQFTTQSFFTKPAPTTYLGKPVYVLVSAHTFSGGEEFTYDLKTQKRGVIVGETTGGGANPGGGVRLGHQFSMFIPTGRAQNPITGTNWESVGVKPDVPTPPAAALKTALLLALGAPGAGDATLIQAVQAEPVGAGDATSFVETRLMSPRTAARPESEPALRAALSGLVAGAPNYSLFSLEMAEATRQELPDMKAIFSSLGPLTSVAFVRVSSFGDEFKATFAHGALAFDIVVGSDGKIALFGFRPA
jgi:hypothetical protein